MKRYVWTQAEVVEMGKRLGIPNFDRRAIRYWIEQKIFPAPVAEVKGSIQFYDDELIDAGFYDIGRRIRTPMPISYEDIKWAKEEVLKNVRSKNITMLIKKINERERIGLGKDLDKTLKKYVRTGKKYGRYDELLGDVIDFREDLGHDIDK